MNLIQNFISDLPMYLLSLPIVLLSLSVHECCHGYVALKLGDPTARNFGRLTLNPLKHIDPIGFICMVLFHFGWANPVPINTRYFKKPRRDMALSALAGPVSNILLAIVFAALLRLAVLIGSEFFMADITSIISAYHFKTDLIVSRGFIVFAMITVMLYFGVIINFGYALFNLIPIPPLDGSRIFYVFLPVKWYFGIMRYERIIMFVMLGLLWLGVITVPLNWALNGLENATFFLFGMGDGTDSYYVFRWIEHYVASMLTR